MIQALTRSWTQQGEIIERMQATTQLTETFIEEQCILNAELVSLHRDIDTRLGRIEALLERMLPGPTNGREA